MDSDGENMSREDSLLPTPIVMEGPMDIGKRINIDFIPSS